MSGPALATLIDLIAADLCPHLGTEEAADAVAVEFAGEITSRYLVVEKPPETERKGATL